MDDGRDLFLAEQGIVQKRHCLFDAIDDGDVGKECHELIDALGVRVFPDHCVERKACVRPYREVVAKMVGSDFIVHVLLKSWEEEGHESALVEVFDSTCHVFRLDHLVYLVAHSGRGGVDNEFMLVDDGLPCFGVEHEALLMLETYATEHTHGILSEDLVRVACGAQVACLEVGNALAARVDDLARVEVLIEGVAGIVATHCIFFERAEMCLDEFGALLIVFFDMRLDTFD